MRKIALVLIAVFLFAPAAWACFCPPPDTYTFDVSLINVTVDANRSANNTLGFDDWYVWKYKVEVLDGADVESGATLKHWVLELPDCYLTSPQLFQEIEASAGWGRPCKLSVYDPEAVDPDGETGLSGMKWAFELSLWPLSLPLGDEWWNLDHDYFWFSAPTDVAIETDWGIKAGKWCGNGTIVTGKVDGPACPPAVIPEPMSLALFGAGLAALSYRRKRERINL